MNASSRSSTAIVLSFFVAALSAACSGPAGGGAPSTSSTSQELTAQDAPTTAVDVLRRGGTFLFALEESDPATFLHQMCARQGADADD